MDEMGGLADARTRTEVIREVARRFAPGTTLFAVDHEFGHLVGVERLGEQVDLRGDLRAAMLQTRRHFDGERTWVPLADREQVVFVAAVPGDHSTSDEDHDAVGSVLTGHRARFEDLERERRRAEMAVAAELQWDLLPIRADILGHYQVAGILEPAYEVAGDVFEYAMNGDSVWAYSFDGMGHGLEATITSVLVLSSIRNARRQGASLTDQMSAASELLWNQYEGSRFVTGAACRLDADGTVEIVNAGHEPVRTVVGGRISRLELDADLPLGVTAGAAYTVQRAASLAAGDGLVMFSDGPASQTVDGKRYGDDLLDTVLEAKWCETPLQTGHDVIGDVLAFIGDGRVDDDITAVVIRRDSAADSGRS